jgi:hypothetical protein
MIEEEFDDKHWQDALGSAPVLDFTSRVFTCKAAMVKKEPVNGHRIWTEYDPATFSEEEYEIIPGMWDHEHCAVCWARIQESDQYWENSERQILCPKCHAALQKRG